jgi:uncharacterized protein (TIGR03083 family)
MDNATDSNAGSTGGSGSTADQIITVLRTGHDKLAAFVTSLGSEGVTHASGATEWTVAQVLSHLGSGAEITRAGLDAAVSGTDERSPDFNQSVWDRWNAKSPQDQATDFITADEALVTAYEALDASTRENLRIDLGFLPAPVDLATAAGLRLNEFALHSWDVFVGFDPATTLPSTEAALLFDLSGLMFGWMGHADALNGARGSLAVHLSEPERRFGVEIGDAISMAEEPGAPDGVLSAPAEAWLRLVSGRLRPEHTPATVTVTGDLVSLEDLRRAFPGF